VLKPSHPVRLLLLALGSFTLVGISLAAPAGEDEVTLTPVKYDALLSKIAANKKAKLTIVDAWATWCVPCKENFPHVVEMHKKYADKGLVVVSLSLDEADKPKKIAEATAFLKSKGATFSNYVLEESTDAAFEKLNITAIPAVFLFGPDGKEVKRFTLDDTSKSFSYDDVEKAVRELLDAAK
jgi:thiol-disulfide isomerase/thioredoxin